MLRESTNSVFIEGILSEVNMEYSTFNKNGKTEDAIRGNIKVRVDVSEEQILEIPVQVFTKKLTNSGSKNPSYESLEKVMKEFVSIAAGGIDKADRIRISKARIDMNEYYSEDGRLISYPRIVANFINKISDLSKFKPKAEFNIDFMVAQLQDEVDNEGIETGRLKIMGIVPKYGGKVDIVPFYTNLPDAISAIKTNWTENDSVVATGKVNFTSKVETIVENLGFGEPIEKTKTTSISELVITGGSPEPLSGDFAFDLDEIKTALAERKARLESSKNKQKKKVDTTEKARLDLGF